MPAQDLLPTDTAMGPLTLRVGDLSALTLYYTAALRLEVIDDGADAVIRPNHDEADPGMAGERRHEPGVEAIDLADGEPLGVLGQIDEAEAARGEHHGLSGGRRSLFLGHRLVAVAEHDLAVDDDLLDPPQRWFDEHHPRRLVRGEQQLQRIDRLGQRILRMPCDPVRRRPAVYQVGRLGHPDGPQPQGQSPPANGHGFFRQPPNPLVCCIITGAG